MTNLVLILLQWKDQDLKMILNLYCFYTYSHSFCLSFHHSLLSGIFDTVLSRLGELCLYLMVMTATPFIATQIITHQTGKIAQ